jgi:hypothetical protein
VLLGDVAADRLEPDAAARGVEQRPVDPLEPAHLALGRDLLVDPEWTGRSGVSARSSALSPSRSRSGTPSKRSRPAIPSGVSPNSRAWALFEKTSLKSASKRQTSSVWSSTIARSSSSLSLSARSARRRSVTSS